ncbi:hypothetical protein DFJ74DRAFT_768803 [Hyaloraphidium curvatum]|nr:hypothetical protein DFJ74DRAFT_768803 [Hyaloraphidium curvatum]
MTKSLLVVGGTGFLGSRICREAALRGLRVASLSRRAPSPALLSHAWARSVDWRTGDVLRGDADSAAAFDGRDAAVHCVGQLLSDAAYKDALQAGDPAALARAAAGAVGGSLAGAAKSVAGLAMAVAGGLAEAAKGRPAFAAGGYGAGSGTGFGSGFGGVFSSSASSASSSASIYTANRDSALAAASAAATAKVPQFVFVSAADPLPFRTDYADAKRQAERLLLDPAAFTFETVVLRPGLMYSDSRPPTLPIAAALSVLSSLSTPLRALIPRAADFPLPAKPLHVDVVARAVVELVVQGGGSGIRNADEIEELGE